MENRLLILIALSLSAQAVLSLPYGSTNPVIYDNDAVVDVYTDDYLMALASAGEINLKGMITSSSIQPYNKWVPEWDYEHSAEPEPTVLNMVVNRAHGVTLAQASGFVNLPDAVRGTKGNLVKPSSGKIEDTEHLGSAGTDLIVREARLASASKPLVVVMGGPLTVAADAYLTDPSIADKVIVAWLGGRLNEEDMNDYNGWADGWAAYIVLQKFRVVIFPANYWDPQVPKARLPELPDTSLRLWMIGKKCPTNILPDERDADAQPAISLMRGDYVISQKPMSFSHWVTVDGHDAPALKEDANGRCLLVTNADRNIATSEWWRAMKDPDAWGTSPPPVSCGDGQCISETCTSCPQDCGQCSACGDAPSGSFLGCYYDGDSYSTSFTTLKATRSDAVIDFNWGTMSPLSGVSADHFSVIWQGVFGFDTAPYTFTLEADDGVRLYVDGELLLDEWQYKDNHIYTVTRQMSAGPHTIKVEYREGVGDAVLRLNYEKCGNSVCSNSESCATCPSDCPCQCIHAADLNPCDNCVKQDELLQFISKWKSSQVSLASLMEAIRLWKQGSC